jgi:hypothetical protein
MSDVDLTEGIPQMDNKTNKAGAKRLARLTMRAMLEADPGARHHFKVPPHEPIVRMGAGTLASARSTLDERPHSAHPTTAPTPEALLSEEKERFLRKVARDRRSLAELIGDAAEVAHTLEAGGAALDPEVRLGLARAHDLLILLASAMAPKDHAELIAKHEALAGIRQRDPQLGDLGIVVGAALSADWRRLEEARRNGFPATTDAVLH